MILYSALTAHVHIMRKPFICSSNRCKDRSSVLGARTPSTTVAHYKYAGGLKPPFGGLTPPPIKLTSGGSIVMGLTIVTARPFCEMIVQWTCVAAAASKFLAGQAVC